MPLRDTWFLDLLYSALVSDALFTGVDIGWFSSRWGGRVGGESSKWAPGLIKDLDITPRADTVWASGLVCLCKHMEFVMVSTGFHWKITF